MNLPQHFNFKNILYQRFNRLLVIEYAGKQNTRHAWKCLCDCGNKTIVASNNIVSEHTTSCGCYMKEQTSKRSKTHGKTKTSEYSIWCDIKKRCYNSNSFAYKYYGSRGIAVCDRWLNSFENFLYDMGNRPSKKHSIDRIDNNGNYEKINCRWTTKDIQSNNTRQNKKVTINNKSMNIIQWLTCLKIPQSTYYNRLGRGWSVENSLTKPIKTIPTNKDSKTGRFVKST